MLNKRSNGVLMHISSLPGPFGIGTMGKSAYDFVNYLKDAKQTYWQILPICPTSFGDSPYQSFSTFAGNPYFIDFELLEKDGLISKSDYEADWGTDQTSVDYAKLYVERHKVFAKIQKKFEAAVPSDYEDFCNKNSFWLEDYALFMACKDAHNGVSFDNWETDLKIRKSEALEEYSAKCAERIRYYKMLQYLFYKQWFALKSYANSCGIKIIGDIPIYVAADSSDVWSSPDQFMLNKETFQPVEVAGCPPDAFSEDGQLWGNPVYNWDYMKSTDYAWWKKRLEKSFETYDVVRIDHFRGFDSFYSIPFGMKNAKIGEWKKGPGMDLFNSLKKQFGDNMSVIAEDLGYQTESVKQLLKDSGFPGMKILEFAFDSREESDYIPYRYTHNCVVYTGTHDNDTVKGWCSSASKEDVANAKKFLRVTTDEECVKEMMICGMASVADTCILCMQDLICLGSEARMNTPSTVGKNWKWRATVDQISKESGAFLREYTELYGRC